MTCCLGHSHPPLAVAYPVNDPGDQTFHCPDHLSHLDPGLLPTQYGMDVIEDAERWGYTPCAVCFPETV